MASAANRIGSVAERLKHAKRRRIVPRALFRLYARPGSDEAGDQGEARLLQFAPCRAPPGALWRGLDAISDR